MGKGGKQNLEKSVREMIAAIECGPEDLPEMQVQLASEYQKAGRLADAEMLCLAAYPYMSDMIGFVEQFEKLLIQQAKLNEADRMSNLGKNLATGTTPAQRLKSLQETARRLVNSENGKHQKSVRNNTERMKGELDFYIKKNQP